MDYTNIIISLGTIIATVISLSKIMGKKFDKIDQRFDKIEDSLKEVRNAIHKLEKRITRIEDRLEFSNKIVYVQQEELNKEN